MQRQLSGISRSRGSVALVLVADLTCSPPSANDRHAPSVDAVLLSQPDLAHLGALPYARAHLGLDCPVYATRPVIQMGQMFLYDSHQARYAAEDFDVFTLDQVDDAFDSITPLKFSQSVQLPSGMSRKRVPWRALLVIVASLHVPLARFGVAIGIKITPFAAGGMIGGSIWRISKDNEDILYAVDYNNKKERHLDGTVLENLTRPTLMITGARRSVAIAGRQAGRQGGSATTPLLCVLGERTGKLTPVPHPGNRSFPQTPSTHSTCKQSESTATRRCMSVYALHCARMETFSWLPTRPGAFWSCCCCWNSFGPTRTLV